MNGLCLSIQLEISSSLTFTPSFFRGVGKNNQPILVVTHSKVAEHN